MADLTGSTFADIFPKLLQDPGDGTIQKSDGTAGATDKANISGGNTFTGVQDFTNRIDANAGISFDGGVNVLSNFETDGAFTPFFSPQSGSFASVTYGVQSGWYERKGNDTVEFGLQLTTNALDIGTAGGQLEIGGLPFSFLAISGISLNVMSQWDFTTDIPQGNITVRTVGSFIRLHDDTVNGDSSRVRVSDLNTATATNRNAITIGGTAKIS